MVGNMKTPGMRLYDGMSSVVANQLAAQGAPNSRMCRSLSDQTGYVSHERMGLDEPALGDMLADGDLAL